VSLQKLKGQATIQGFRKGKAPLQVIEKVYGEQLSSEVSQNLLQEALPSAMQEQMDKESKLKFIGRPTIDHMHTAKRDAEFHFCAILENIPEVELKEYNNLGLKKEKIEVAKSELDEQMNRLTKMHAKTKNAEENAPAEAGNVIQVSLIVKDENGEVVPALSSESRYFELEEKNPDWWLGQNFIGTKKNQSVEFETKTPADFPIESLREKNLKISSSVKELQTLEVPALDDEFAKDLGKENLTQLTADTEQQLLEQKQTAQKSELEKQAMDKVFAANTIEAPPSMVDSCINDMIARYPWQKKEEYDSAIQNPKLRESVKESAERHAKEIIVLWKVAEQEGIKVTDEVVKNQIADDLKKDLTKDASEIDKMFQTHGDSIRESLTRQKALEVLVG
jgi:trigger factor